MKTDSDVDRLFFEIIPRSRPESWVDFHDGGITLSNIPGAWVEERMCWTRCFFYWPSVLFFLPIQIEVFEIDRSGR